MRKVQLTLMQSKLFNLLMKAASEDEAMDSFLRTPATGKTFVMGLVYDVLNTQRQVQLINPSISKVIIGDNEIKLHVNGSIELK